MPASDKEAGVISFCLNCSYRLPIHTVMNGFRRATAKFGRNRLKLANSSAVDGQVDSGDNKTSHGPTSNDRIIPPESYSRHLRVIGQQLQQEGIDSFNLQCGGDGYSVWTRAHTVTWPNRSLFSFSNRLENLWSIRHDGYPSRVPDGHARFEYSLDDLARMDLAARIHRDPASGFANGHSLSQLLRTIGSLAYQRNHRLLAISWRDISICAVLETSPGKRPWIESYLNSSALALASARSLIATSSRS